MFTYNWQKTSTIYFKKKKQILRNFNWLLLEYYYKNKIISMLCQEKMDTSLIPMPAFL